MKMKQFDTAATRRLYTALENNNVREFQAMHDEGYPIATNSFGGEEWKKTSLMMLVDQPNAQLASVKKLIQLGSRLDAVDSYNNTPLHIAMSNPDNNPKVQAKIIEYLIRKGANLEALDNGGNPPLQRVREIEDVEIRGAFVDSFQQAELYVVGVKKTMIRIQEPNERKKYFDDAMESDDMYDKAMIGSGILEKDKQRSFVAREARKKTEQQQTVNPLLSSLVTNEGGYAGAVLKQQEEKKKESCCIVM